MSNTTITHLDLAHNNLGVDGGLGFLEGLKHNKTLVDCQLSGCKVGEEIIHEVALLLRKNRVHAAAQHVGAGDATEGTPEAQAKAASKEEDTRDQIQELRRKKAKYEGTQAITPWWLTPLGSTGRSFPSTKHLSSLMLWLMIKEHDQVLQDEKLFFQQVQECIEQLKLEASQDKQDSSDAEEREKRKTSDFVEIDARYNKEIRAVEESLEQCIADKEDLQYKASVLLERLKCSNEENAKAMRESVEMQEHAMAQEEALRTELRAIIAEKRALQDKLALGQKDLELLDQENRRLREHVKSFQSGTTEIFN